MNLLVFLVVGVYVCCWWRNLLVVRLTCILGKVLVQLVTVSVLGDVTHEEPVVVV